MKNQHPLFELFLNDKQMIERMVHPILEKRLIVTPLISLKHQLGGDSLDVRLGPEFVLVERAEHTYVDPVEMIDISDQEIEAKHRRIKRISPLYPFILHPEEKVLCSTLESFQIPVDLIAFLEGRSTWAKYFVGVHSHAGLIHAGTRGVITFEFRNSGFVPIKLYTGTRVAQLSFASLSSEPVRHYIGEIAKYSGSIRTELGRPWEDYEFEIIKKAIEQDEQDWQQYNEKQVADKS